MIRFLLRFPCWTVSYYYKQSCYFNDNLKTAWRIISETLSVAAPHCEISDEMMKVILLILKNYESLFCEVEWLPQLKITMTALHKYPECDDLVALGTLLYWETQNTAFSVAKVDSETLTKKATQCLKIWIHWFLLEGNKILENCSYMRVMLSLRFLRTVAELAIVNFQNFMAVTSLSYVNRLAYLVKHKDITREATQAIITLCPQMGLQYVSTNNLLDTESFMSHMHLHLLHLTAIATHHLKSGEFHKFLIVRDAAYSQFQLSNKTCEARTVVPFAKAVIKRLEAEFLMIPGSRQLEETKAGCRKPLLNALRLAKQSLFHIGSLCKFGDDFPRLTSARDTPGPWTIVHEYLCILKLIGDILQYTGLISKAMQYLECGLLVADKFQLVTWGAILSSKLIEQQLILGNLELATSELQHAQSFLRYRTPTLKADLDHCHLQPRVDFIPVDKLGCGLKISDVELKHTHFKEDIFSDLLEDTKLETGDQKSAEDQPNYLFLRDIKACCSCCQTEIVGVGIHLMCLQAEILWRKETSICQVSSLLQHSLNMAHQFSGMAPCKNLINYMAESGWKVCPLNYDIASNKRTLAETALKSAQIYFQNLYIRNSSVQTVCEHIFPGADNILRLLDIVETVGKKTAGLHLCHVLVASSLLTRHHCTYLTVLKTSPDEDIPEGDSYPDNPCRSSIFHTINLAVSFAKEKKKIWDNRRSLLLCSVEPLSLVDLPYRLDCKPPINESGHHTDKPSLFEQLTRYFPSLSVYRSGNHATERIICLQRVFEQFQEFPHSLLYRQASQSLALCLWEKQLAEMCGGIRVKCSSQAKIAAYLTDSMHVTFRHMMVDNFVFKLSGGVTWKNQSTEEAQVNREAMREAMNWLRFGSDVMENFRNRLASLPADWTVVQMTTVNLDPTNPGTAQIFITRLNSTQEPITIGLPNNRRQFLKIAQKSYENGGLLCHEECLPWKRDHILETLLYMQEVCLGGYKWFLRGQLDCAQQKCVQNVLEDAGKKAANILQQQGIHICHTELKNLVEILLGATEADILSLVACMLPHHVTGTVTQICLDAQKEVTRMCGDLLREKRSPVILILDNETLLYMQEVCLGGYKWFLRGQLDCAQQKCVQNVLEDAGKKAANILQQQGIHICHTELKNLVEILLGATEADILSLVACMLPHHVTGTVTQICLDAQKEVTRMCGDLLREKRSPVILILDNETLLYMQEVCLGGYKWFLRGQLDCAQQKCVQNVLEDAGKKAANILQQQGIHICHTELKNLVEILLGATEADILSLVACMLPHHVTGTVTQICLDAQKEVTRMCGDLLREKRSPVILILDNTWHKKMARSAFEDGVERTSVIANIGNTCKKGPEPCLQLAEHLKKYPGWLVDCYEDTNCLMELEPRLQNCSLYLYKGHSLADFSHVQAISGRAVAISMSCRSSLLKTKKNVDGDGAPLYFLLAGCPSFAGNLTVSYQYESLEMISKLSSCWMAQSQPILLRELLVTASQATGYFGTCGTRLLIYGLPVKMN